MRFLFSFYMGACVAALLCMEPAVCHAQNKNSELDALRKAAQTELSSERETIQQDDVFTSGALGLQRLNPEISVTGDLLWSLRDQESDDTRSDFNFRGLGLHVEAYLDPYTRFKAAASFSETGTTLGEAYMTRFGIWPHVNLTLGKFRQQFGVVNRWHKHGLDQVDFPLALRMIFGDGGLDQPGGSLDWTMPAIGGLSQELMLQVTDGENPRVFGENEANDPSGLLHYKIYKDLSDSTYVELGLSGLVGQNNVWQMAAATNATAVAVSEPTDTLEDKSLSATVLGADLTLLWEPTERMRYRSITWRSEVYSLNKDILAADGSGEDTINAWGVYSYLEGKVSRTVVLGVRGDYFEPDLKSYADTADAPLSPLAVTEENAYRWQVSPYITWHQSPFVHFRAEYNHQDGKGTGPEEKVVWLQCIFAAGPHKHERY